MPNQDRSLKITRHAYERAYEFQLTPSKLVWMFWNSEPESSPPGKRQDSKFADKTRYFRHGTFVFVAGETDHKDTGEPIYLLLTVYDQRMSLPRYLYK